MLQLTPCRITVKEIEQENTKPDEQMNNYLNMKFYKSKGYNVNDYSTVNQECGDFYNIWQHLKRQF